MTSDPVCGIAVRMVAVIYECTARTVMTSFFVALLALAHACMGDLDWL